MKVEQLLTEHKKGVKAVKYAKKPTPLIGPEALKRKEDQKKKAAVKKVEPMSESTDDEENYYYRVRHQTKRDIELEMPPKAWDSVGPKYATYDEAKAAFDELKSKHPNEKFTYTRHPRISHVGGKPSHAFPEGVAEGKIKIKIKHPPETAQEKLYKKHQELRKKSGLPDPEEYKKNIEKKQKEIDDMKEAKQPEAPKPRNFVAKNAKTAGAGKHKDAKKAANTVRGQKHKNKEIAEAEMGKIIDYKPGQTATLNTGPGMTTIVDLKKNPTSLTKDPATGKLKLVGPQAQGAPAQQSTQQSTIKAGDQVEIGKTTEDLLRLAGLR